MKIGRPFIRPKPAHWKLRKARAAYINRMQQYIDDDAIRPDITFAVEIELEQSTALNPRYLFTETSGDYIAIGIPYLMYEQSTAEDLLYIYNEAKTSTIIEDYE